MRLSRSDLLQTTAIEHKCLVVLPLGKNSTQKIAIGDCDGILQTFSVKKSEVVSTSRSLAKGAAITAVCSGNGNMQRDKIFYVCQDTIHGTTKKGKEFYRFSLGSDDPIKAIAVNESTLIIMGETIVSGYSNNKQVFSYKCKDILHDIAVVLPPTSLPTSFTSRIVLGCRDATVKVLQGGDLYYEKVLEAAVTSVEVYEPYAESSKAQQHTASMQVIYGTVTGVCGLLNMSTNAIEKAWTISNEKGSGPITCTLCNVDITGNGLNDIIIGRNDGALEVYSMVAEKDSQLRPQLLARRDMMGSISAIGAGIVLRPEHVDICVATFGGNVIGLEVDLDGLAGDFETHPSNVEGTNAKEMQPSTKIVHDFRNSRPATIRKRNQHEILMRDIKKLEKQVENSKNYYEALLREDNVHVDLYTKSNLHAKYSLNLDKATALHILQIECNLSIFAVVIHSEVPMKVMDTEDVQCSIIRNPIDDSPEEPTETFMASFRCIDAANRLCVSLRILEGNGGTLYIHTICQSSPKQYLYSTQSIYPLGFHRRLTADEDKSQIQDVPFTRLVISGEFSLQEMHSWVMSLLPEVPSHPPAEKGSLHYQHTVIGSLLVCNYQEGRGVFESNCISTIAIIKDIITKSATAQYIRISISFELSNDSLTHCLECMRPGIEKLCTTMKQFKVLTALQSINPQVGKANQPNCFSEKYRQIFQNETQIQSSGRTVDEDSRFMFGFIQSIFVDWHAFKSRSVKGQLSALQQLFYAGDIDALYRFMANPLQN